MAGCVYWGDVLRESASSVSSIAKSPLRAYFLAYDEAAPVTWLASMPFLASSSRANAVACTVFPSFDVRVAVALT